MNNLTAERITTPDLICFSHLRWNFVYQRPQHLMTRFSKCFRVFFIEEPIFDATDKSFLQVYEPDENKNLLIIVPHLVNNLPEKEILKSQRILLKKLFTDHHISDYTFWYYTPMALTLGNFFRPKFIIYDCMDELSTFKFAPPALKQRETELFEKADLVFTGGHNLYQAKKKSHHNIHPIPSSIDKDHFLKARKAIDDPVDQINIPHPRFGFYGVVDERFDLDLLKTVAEKRPEWQLVIIGPVVKISPDSLPRLKNIHYIGGKSYLELPSYLSGWDITIIPFLLNDFTKYISPTKTPEYLAAGKPVISTSIVDVVNPYGVNGLVHIADNAKDFIKIAKTELGTPSRKKWLAAVDDFLSGISWDNTWSNMMYLINKTINEKNSKLEIKPFNKKAYV